MGIRRRGEAVSQLLPPIITELGVQAGQPVAMLLCWLTQLAGRTTVRSER